MRLIDLFLKNERGTMLTDVAKAGLAIAFLSVIAVNFVSSRIEQFDKDRLAEVSAAAIRGKPIDPMITGSLRKTANETRLDPCVVPR